jgi:Mn-dependent DtxR family transcriptional regulator
MRYHALAEPDLFVELVKRAPVLDALRDGPSDRKGLERQLGVSTATSYRRTGWLTKRGLIEERDDAFVLTALGAEVDAQVTDLRDAVSEALGGPWSTPERLAELLGYGPTLAALREEPLDRRTLQERLEVSRSTCHRHARNLTEAGLVERPANEYDLTPTGEVVADAVSVFTTHVRAALTLGPVLDRIHGTDPDFDVGFFADATVTTAEPGNSSRPVARAISLFRGTETFRGVRTAAIAPMYLEDERVLDGLPTEVIEPPEVVEEIMEEYPERCVEVCVSEYFTHWLHEDLPFGLVIYDDRVGIGVEGTEGVATFVDTDASAAQEWAEAVFESLRREAVLLEGYTKRGLRETLATRSSGDRA